MGDGCNLRTSNSTPGDVLCIHTSSIYSHLSSINLYVLGSTA